MSGLVRAFLAVCILGLSAAAAATASAQDFVIEDYDVSILVDADASFSVREQITVRFQRPRHGIYRDIPFVYLDTSGHETRTPTSVLSVEDGAGVRRPHKVITEGNVLRVRIGDPDSYVEGRQVYEILYRVENAILFFADHDELYWNVTGNAWQAPIMAARATVSLAAGTAAQRWSACYTGRAGSTETACRSEAAGTGVVFSATRSLAAGEGLTIAYGWDKGLVSAPSAFRRLLWSLNLRQNWVFVIPVFSLLVMLWLWWTTGRDPRVREAVTVRYDPPVAGGAALNPAEVGTILDEQLDSRDITATIVGLAVKGYIRVEETKKEGIIFDSTDYYLRKLKEPDSGLTAFEHQLLGHLLSGLPGRPVSELKNSFYVHVESLKRSLYADLVDKKFFRRNPENVRQTYVGAAVVLGVLTIAGLSFFFGSTLGDVRPLLTGVLAALPVFGFSRIMPAKSRAGALAFMEVLGFREFLEKAEKDRLERMKDENLFSKYFPYALALNVADNWAEAFEGIYQVPPDWYTGTVGMRTFSPVSFSRSMNSAMSNISSAIFSAPRGSGTGGGFGGGGSSGGGFGGGGGGSW